jgi:hypothetical protein
VNRRIVLVVALVTAVAVAAVVVDRWANRASAAASPEPSAAAPAAVEGTDIDPSFAVRIRAEPAVYRSGQPIHITAWLTYTGPKAQEKLVGSGSGFVLFSWEQLDGRLHQEAVATADCVPYSIKRDEALAVPFAKTGAFQGDDPDVRFWQRYFADPVFRLPAGRYRIHAVPSFTVGECGGPAHHLDASVEILVLP